MMEKVDVHGPDAHPVFKFFQLVTGARITWNFGVYFVVDRHGGVNAYPDVNPSALTRIIGEL